jgi:hypothetical protein
MKALRHFAKHDGLVFHSKNNGTLAETTILTQGLHPAVKALGLPKAGMHAFRRGCNRRWELARISSAVIRQQMGHATADVTPHAYTGARRQNTSGFCGRDGAFPSRVSLKKRERKGPSAANEWRKADRPANSAGRASR